MYPVFLVAVLLAGQPPIVTDEAAPPVCQACGDKCACGPDCCCELSYDTASPLAARQGMPLIVFVGQPARKIAGAVSCRAETFEDVPKGATAVVIAFGTERYADLGGCPTDATISAVCRRELPRTGPLLVKVQAVNWQPPPMPFRGYGGGGFGGGFGSGGNVRAGNCKSCH
jgi:hypothetical protein